MARIGAFALEVYLSKESHPEMLLWLGNTDFIVSIIVRLLLHFLLVPENRLEASSLLFHQNTWALASVSGIISSDRPSEVSSLGLESLSVSQEDSVNEVEIFLRDSNVDSLSFNIIGCVKHWSLVLGSSEGDASYKSGDVHQDRIDTLELSVFSVGSDSQMGLARHFVIPEAGPINLHELVISGNNNVLWDLGESINVVLWINDKSSIMPDGIIKLLHHAGI